VVTDWREELIEQMAKAIAVRPQDSEDRWWIWEPEARAALAVAEPVIREQADNALREENARLREDLAGAIKRMSKLDFERTAAEFERDALREENARLRKLLFDFEKFQEIYEKAMEAK
jgi:hypothetical protein